MKNIPTKKSIISLAIGSAFATALGTASIASASENPFTAQSLDKGYMVAGHHEHGGGYGEKTDGHGGMKDKDKKYGEGRCGMSMADTDKDGRVSKEEHARHSEKMFEMMDKNRDGFIDKDEAKMMKKKHGESRRSDDQYGSRDRSGQGDRSGYGDRSGQGDRSGYDEQYGTRSGDRELQHMRPMGE